MKKLPVQFRCYAKFDHDVRQWVAVCVDLCLAAQAGTLEEAKKKLHSQVIDYVQDALEAPTLKQTLQMLDRRAPISQRLFYLYLKICLALGIGGGNNHNPTRFKETVRPDCVAA